MCCGKGKVQLPPWRLPPEPLMGLYTGMDRDSRQFRQRIRSYNSALQLAISTVQVVRGITYHQGAGAVAGGVQQVRIQGTVHHMLPPLRHAPDQPPRFAQLYILDPDAAARQRFEVFSALEATTLRRLQDMLQQHHAFAHAYTRPELRDLPDVQLVINADNRALDRRVYNAPTAPEVAAFLPDAQLEGDVAPHRRIVLHSRAEPGRMTYISDLNSAYDPLHFVLLHPWGELGWGLDIPHRDVLHGSPVAGVARPAPGVAAERDGDRGVDADGSVASDDEAAAALDAEAAADAVALAAAGTAQEPPASPVGAAAQRRPRANGPDSSADEASEDEHGRGSDAGREDEEEAAAAGEWHGDSDGDGDGEAGSRAHDFTTSREYAAFMVMIRDAAESSDHLFRAGRLFQEWLCDQWAKVENQRLRWCRMNQAKLRADQYRGLCDAYAHGATEAAHVGHQVILPSTFIGGPRHMQQLMQDSMAVVAKHGKPDLFITMTCNPRWPEIQLELLPGQQAADRPDIVARVFALKLKELLQDLTKKAVLGRVVAHMHTIEFQKRGLPHAHLLLIMAPEDKLRSADDFDRVISAEIPDPEAEPELYATVKACMMHGPCGPGFNPNSPCMADGHCSKRYPREFLEASQETADGYPLYRRRNNGRTVEVGGHRLDNRWVVPYNPALTKKFNCHINVECCGSVRAVKYIYKYIYKGYDRAQLAMIPQGPDAAPAAAVPAAAPPAAAPPAAAPPAAAPAALPAAAPAAGPAAGPSGNAAGRPRDEVHDYQTGRYVSAMEAMWRVTGMDMHGNAPSVTRLQVHLPGEQTVTFLEDLPLRAVVAEGPKATTLEAWFTYNATHDDARDILYPDMVVTHSFDKRTRRWTRRTAMRVRPSLGRMYHVMPNQGERFYLRLLLIHVAGATSYAHLRTVDGTEHRTFQAAAEALGLLQHDGEWVAAMREAAQVRCGRQLRTVFACILLSGPANARELWQQFAADLAEDFAREAHAARAGLLAAATMPPLDAAGLQACQEEALRDIDVILRAQGRSLAQFDLPQPPPRAAQARGDLPALVQQQITPPVLRGVLRERVARDLPLTNAEQRALYNAVMADVQAVAEQERAMHAGRPAYRLGARQLPSRAHFIDASGGCGKTFIFNLLLATVRAEGEVALAVATSGIAALLLDGGTTAHSRFRLPLEPAPQSTCGMAVNSEQAEVIRRARLCVWDEAPMCHRECFAALDRLLRDIMRRTNNALGDVPFGGKVIVFAGDFRQVPPVVRRGSRADTVNASLRCSPLWAAMTVHHLRINMRVQRLLQQAQVPAGAGAEGVEAAGAAAAAAAAEAQRFADWLLRVGDGAEECAPDLPIPDAMRARTQRPGDLITAVFGDLAALAGEGQQRQELLDRVIKRAILTPRNDDAADINAAITNLLPGEEQIYHASNALDDSASEEAQNLYNPEFLNSLTPQGMPPSLLRLKVGMPVILLRNLNTALGLANGTRLLITNMRRHTLQADILTGPRVGQPVILCRIPTTTTDPHLPFHFTRRQFPIRPAFAMTINKSQGQTFDRVGVYLPKPCFSHGQLYVALSRVGAADAITIMALPQPRLADGTAQQPDAPEHAPSAASTTNVVFHELLLQQG